MAILSSLVEFLLAYQRPDGGRIARLFALTNIVWLPAFFTLTYDIYPRFGAYANIGFYYMKSPSLVPEAFHLLTSVEGMEFELGPISTVTIGTEAHSWYITTQNSPIHTTIENRTPLIQREDMGQQMLIIDTEEDFKLVMDIIRDFGNSYAIRKEVAKTNAYLHAIAHATPGAILPEEPIGGGS